ncbi:MAG TPA: hypothetical protein GX693_04320, partial [Firmicutes bacterium]|nr:hypothetical protein [Bacillota bacterium]
MKVDLPASGMEGQLRTALSPGAGRGPCCDLDFLAALLEELQRASCQMAGINGEWGDPVTLPAGLEEPTLLEVPSEPGDDQILSGESVIPVLVPEIPGLPVPAGGVLAEGEAEAVAPAGLDLEAPGSLWPLDAGASPFELPARSHREAAEQALPGTEAVSSKPDQALAANQGQAIRPYGGAFLLDGTDYYQVLEADPQPVDPGSRRDGFFIQPDLHAEPGREVSGKLLDVNLEQGAVVGQSVNAGPVSLGAEGRQASGDPG